MSMFYLGHGGERQLRLSVSHPQPDEIEEGVRRIAQLIVELPGNGLERGTRQGSPRSRVLSRERRMNVKRALGVAAGLALAATGVVVGFSQPASAATTFATPTMCTIQTFNTNNFLTAVGGGGQTSDVIHTDATVAQGWEAFTLVDAGDGVHVGIRTLTGNYLTAVGGGGREVDVIHSNATALQAWEKFNIIRIGGDGFAIQTIDGHYLTAVDGGGRTTDVIHSDATQVQAWEIFRFNCGLALVPNVRFFDDRSARNDIIAAGLSVGQISFDTHCFNPAGTVELQNPTGGALVLRGTAVNLREDAPGCVGM
jgi:hypothetical protein